jgi:hypothetical protein
MMSQDGCWLNPLLVLSCLYRCKFPFNDSPWSKAAANLPGSILQLVVAVLVCLGRQVNIKISFQVSSGKFGGDRELQCAQRAIEKEKDGEFEKDRESFVSSDASYIEDLNKGSGKES